MQLLALPALSDNYIWLLHDNKQALVVDPGVAEPVQQCLQAHGLQLAHLCITHQHHDHIDGVAALLAAQQGQPKVWAAQHPKIQAQTTAARRSTVLFGGEAFAALGLPWQVLAAPGHTLNHVLFYCPAVPLAQGERPVLFCGDTLFSAGCGRLFEGSPAQMLQSLARIAALPDDTLVCCTHEYTLSNLRFALSLQPEHPRLLAQQAACLKLRAQGRPTLPSTLAAERSFNPFLQVLDPAWARAMALHLALAHDDALTVFTALREMRNQFS